MPNTKISALPSITLTGSEIVPVVTGGTNYGVTTSAIAALKTAGASNQVIYNSGGTLVGDVGITYTLGKLAVANTITISSPSTVANLPSVLIGSRSFVTDATANTWGTVVVGSGAFKVPVWSDGVSWFIG